MTDVAGLHAEEGLLGLFAGAALCQAEEGGPAPEAARDRRPALARRSRLAQDLRRVLRPIDAQHPR